jgi:hypothetical protein
VYNGSKLDLKVNRKFVQTIPSGGFRGKCVEPDFPPGTSKTDTHSIGARKYKGKRPRIGIKSVRKRQLDGKNELGRPFTADFTLTVKFSTAKKAKVTYEYERITGSEVCTGKATFKVNGIIRAR